MTTETDRPLSLRKTLRELQGALDDAASANMAHRAGHGCREGSGCAAGLELAARVEQAQGELAMTRFLNEDG